MLTLLKNSQIKNLTILLKNKQGYMCPLCKGSLAYGRTALDHDHSNGRVRAVLCHQCNRSEGKVRVGMQYMAISTHLTRTSPIAWLRNLADYLEHHQDHLSSIIHPTFDLTTKKQKPKKRVRRKGTKK